MSACDQPLLGTSLDQRPVTGDALSGAPAARDECHDVRARFDALFTRLLPALYRRSHSLSGARHLAEDAVHETYLKLAARPGALLDHAHPHAYACSALLSVTRDAWRREQRMVPTGEWHIEPAAREEGTEDRLAELMALHLLRSLTERQAQAVILVDIEGHTLDEAARLLGVHRGTVAQFRRRALERLRHEVQVESRYAGPTPPPMPPPAPALAPIVGSEDPGASPQVRPASPPLAPLSPERVSYGARPSFVFSTTSRDGGRSSRTGAAHTEGALRSEPATHARPGTTSEENTMNSTDVYEAPVLVEAGGFMEMTLGAEKGGITDFAGWFDIFADFQG
ncbi:sigma-70 family RNA polymerase sigma factor [Streptomyces roseolus]|uniref:sigma-70 family RNA polymerase sigma factor n=1 Tax=Streptomyces roseolus TaxID=67358 RepID=UPI003644220A